MIILECGTWYHHPRRQQCVLNRNLRIFKVAMWHYRSRHHLKHNCIWDNLLYCCLSFYSWIYISNWTTIQSKGNYDICVYWRKSATCSRSQPLLYMIIGGKFEATLWRYRCRHHLEKKTFFGMIWDDLFISEVKLKLCLIFQIFQNGRHFELTTNFFIGSFTGSWI